MSSKNLAVIALIVAVACVGFASALPPIRRTNLIVSTDGDNAQSIRRTVTVRRWDLDTDGEDDSFSVRSVIRTREADRADQTYASATQAVRFAWIAARGLRLYPHLAFGAFRSSTDAEADDDEGVNVNRAAGGLALWVQPRGIIEYTDTDGNGDYDEADTVESTCDFKDLAWNPLYYERFDLDEETETRAHAFTVNSTADGSYPDAMVSFRWIGTGTPIRYQTDGAGDVELRPDALELEVGIDGYPYSAASGSRLALNVRWLSAGTRNVIRRLRGSNQEVTEEDSAVDTEEIEGDDGVRAGIRFARTATDGDGNEFEVGFRAETVTSGVGGPVGWRAREAYYSFRTDQPESIYWDPEVGVMPEEAAGPPVAAIVGGALAAVIVVGAIAGLMLKRRR